ncbi:basic salivary proline-rich protein 2-like [Haliotis asinina]|uniref:basic salivary proline-rich protein 2-like n=1 Tax=Haliotis asinina TaxID=109174 RepID=UPI0035323FAA
MIFIQAGVHKGIAIAKMGLAGFRLILMAAIIAVAVVNGRPYGGKGYYIPWTRPKPKVTTIAPYTFQDPPVPPPPQYYSKGSFPGGRLLSVHPKGYVPSFRPIPSHSSPRTPLFPVGPKGQLQLQTLSGLHQIRGPVGNPPMLMNPRGFLPNPRPSLNPNGTLGQSPEDNLDMPKPKKTLATEKEKIYSVTYKKQTRYTKQHTGPDHTTVPEKSSVATGTNQQMQSSQKINPSGSDGQRNSPTQTSSEQQGQPGNTVDPRPTLGQTPDQGQPPSRPGIQPTNPSFSGRFPPDTWKVEDPSIQGSSGPWSDPSQNHPDIWRVAGPSMQRSSGPWSDPSQNHPDTWRVAGPSRQGSSGPWSDPSQNHPDTWLVVGPSRQGSSGPWLDPSQNHPDRWRVVGPSMQGQFHGPFAPRVDPPISHPNRWQTVDPSSQGQPHVDPWVSTKAHSDTPSATKGQQTPP